MIQNNLKLIKNLYHALYGPEQISDNYLIDNSDKIISIASIFIDHIIMHSFREQGLVMVPECEWDSVDPVMKRINTIRYVPENDYIYNFLLSLRKEEKGIICEIIPQNFQKNKSLYKNNSINIGDILEIPIYMSDKIINEDYSFNYKVLSVDIKKIKNVTDKEILMMGYFFDEKNKKNKSGKQMFISCLKHDLEYDSIEDYALFTTIKPVFTEGIII